MIKIESKMSEADANDHAASLVGVPDGSINLRFADFRFAVEKLIEQVRVLGDGASRNDKDGIDELGRKAYQLLLEMHARGAPLPVYIDLPSIVWELKSDDFVLSVSVTIMVNQLDFTLTGTAIGYSGLEQGHFRSTLREFARYAFLAFQKRDARYETSLDEEEC
jgi:hypothetical protein